jgi:PAS domain S-box-containing protein
MSEQAFLSHLLDAEHALEVWLVREGGVCRTSRATERTGRALLVDGPSALFELHGAQVVELPLSGKMSGKTTPVLVFPLGEARVVVAMPNLGWHGAVPQARVQGTPGLGVMEAHTDGHVCWANDVLLRMLGATSEEVASGGLRWDSFAVEDYRELEARMFQALRTVGVAEPRVREYRRRDGTLVPVLCAATRLDDDGHVLAVVLDLSAHPRAEAERDDLLHEEQRLRLAADAARKRVAFLARASELLAASLDYATTLGHVARLAVADLADFCIVDVVDGNGQRTVTVAHRDPALEARLRPAGVRFRLELEVGTAGAAASLHTGEPMLFGPEAIARIASRIDDDGVRSVAEALAPSWILAAPMVARGRPLGVLFLGLSDRQAEPDLSLAIDLAARAALAIDNARLYGEARDAIRFRESVMSIVAHDLKNPINGILLNLRFLAKSLSSGEEAKDARDSVDAIKHACSSMTTLIHDLLDLARIDGGQLTLLRQNYDAETLVRRVIVACEATAMERGITLGFVLPHHPPTVYCDRERFTQVLTNLVSNALKFSPEGAAVTIRVDDIPDALKFSVEDTGPGLSSEHMAHVFDRFWQARPDAAKGTGLGLSIARGLVDAQGGTIGVESTLGRGSTFFFTLPLRPLLRDHDHPDRKWNIFEG